MIVANLLALALDGHGISPGFTATLRMANQVFTWFFVGELATKVEMMWHIRISPLNH